MSNMITMGDNENLEIIFGPKSSLTDRFDAIKKIDNEAAMIEVLLHADSAEIRSYALSRVDNQEAIIEVIKHDPNATLRKFAMEKVDTVYYELFEEVVKQDTDPIVREKAVMKMPPFYHEQYANILKTDKDSRVRHRAAQKLRMDRLSSDQLKDLALNAIDPYIRRAATFSTSDHIYLKEIAIQGDDIQIIQHCIEEIQSEEHLKDIVTKTEFISTKVETISKITDKSFMREVMENETNEQVIKVCQRQLL